MVYGIVVGCVLAIAAPTTKRSTVQVMTILQLIPRIRSRNARVDGRNSGSILRCKDTLM